MAERDREEESQGFKVVDRRLFTPEGERRVEAEPQPPKTAEKPPAAETRTPSRKEPAEAPSAHAEPHAHGPVGFEHLVMSLATTAMYQLGLVKNHEEDQPRVDLEAAKETIDLLDILQQKTKGNLTQEEQGLLEGSLYELRMMFVELSKPGRSR
ncbi:MAG: DUF1844 domain-containing protein [Acidobacteria bacterium]|nr:DUF1844 domain-containing protein [Acidobacteriota bacterium]